MPSGCVVHGLPIGLYCLYCYDSVETPQELMYASWSYCCAMKTVSTQLVSKTIPY